MYVAVTSFSVFLIAGSAWAALPGNLESCKMDAADYGKCLSTQITNAIEFFKSGNRKMGVNPIEPFKFTALTVDQGHGPVAIKLGLKDFEMKGLSKIKINDVKNDWKTMVIKARLDDVEASGDYSINGKVLVLPISGTGKCKILMHGVDVLASLKFSQFEKNGKKYFKVDSFDIDISPTKTEFDFKNLFNGDKALGDNMNLFLNENHDQIIKELKPAISRGCSEGFKQLSNQVMSKMTVADIKALG